MIVLIAALAMLLQDITGVLMMQYEANSLSLPVRRSWRDYVGGGWRAWMAALLDEAQWVVGITTTTISVEAFSGHDLALKIGVFAAVSVANIVGARTGQELGILLLNRRRKTMLKMGKSPVLSLPEQLADLARGVTELVARVSDLESSRK